MGRIERTVVYAVLTLLVLHAAVGIPVLAPRRAEAGDTVPDVVKARAFVVEDAEGKARGALRVLPDGSVVLSLSDAAGTQRAGLVVEREKGPTMTLTDKSGEARIKMQLIGQDPDAAFIGTEGRLTITTMLAGSPKLIFGDGNMARVVLRLENDGTPLFFMKSKDGKVLWEAPPK